MAPIPPVESVVVRLRQLGVTLPPGRLRVGGFGDSAALSEELLALIRAGNKRAGASLLWAHEADDEEIPNVGELEIVVDHRNEPVLITRITGVDVVPYIQVPAEFAAREGEGDRSLEYRRRAHWAFFSRECKRIGREPSELMPVVCASFELLCVVPASTAP